MKLTRYNRVTEVTFFGKEIQNPVLRRVAIVVLVLWGCIMIPLGICMAAFGLAMMPVYYVVHILLRAVGRKGFVDKGPTHFNFTVSREGFQRR